MQVTAEWISVHQNHMYSDKFVDPEKFSDKLKEGNFNILIINYIEYNNLTIYLNKYLTIELPLSMTENQHKVLFQALDTKDYLFLQLVFPIENHSVRKFHKIMFIYTDALIIIASENYLKIMDELKIRLDVQEGKLQNRTVDYVVYILIDIIVHNYYRSVSQIIKKFEKIEDLLLKKPEHNHNMDIYHAKREMSKMGELLYPFREILSDLAAGDYSKIQERKHRYFPELYGHLNNIVQMYEVNKDLVTDLIELNSTNINYNLNRTMKALTVITTIFIPLSLIPGIYGMNFKFMPEISWKWGYPFALILMGITAVSMFLYMKRKKVL
jgi:magnesium transporter